MMSSRCSTLSLPCENERENCKNIFCECLTSETSVEYAQSENEFRESFEEINSEEEEKCANKLSLWQTILEEFRREREDFEEWEREQEKLKSGEPSCEAVEYLNREIFPILLPGMERMLREAHEWNALEVQKCRFNGLDYLAEHLWNKNPRYPERQLTWRGLFEIPPFRMSLRANPRPIYPKSWLWSNDEAALIIQRNVRGWIVRKRRDVQELRQFWKIITAESEEIISSLSSINLDKFDDFRQRNEEIDICQLLSQ